MIYYCFRCDYILDCKGQPQPFSIEKQEQIVKTVIEPMAGDGLRTICIAYKDYRKGGSLHQAFHICIAYKNYRKGGSLHQAFPICIAYKDYRKCGSLHQSICLLIIVEQTFYTGEPGHEVYHRI